MLLFLKKPSPPHPTTPPTKYHKKSQTLNTLPISVRTRKYSLMRLRKLVCISCVLSTDGLLIHRWTQVNPQMDADLFSQIYPVGYFIFQPSFFSCLSNGVYPVGYFIYLSNGVNPVGYFLLN